MTRVRTKKTSKYFTISNSTAQDTSLSFEALGLLTYCLSMPEQWDFHPKIIWKQRNCGRDGCYKMFNELIESYHCIRIRKPNPKSKNLPGEIEYEIFDEVQDCIDRIAELEKIEKFIEHGGNLKKSFRHPPFQYPEPQYPINQDLLKEKEKIKEKDKIKEQQQQTKIAAVFLDEQSAERPAETQIYQCLKTVDIPSQEKLWLMKHYPEDVVRKSLEWAAHPTTTINKNLAAALKWACEHKPDVPVNPEEIIQTNAQLAKKFDRLKNEFCSVYVGNKYIEIVYVGQRAPDTISFESKTFSAELEKKLRELKLI